MLLIFDCSSLGADLDAEVVISSSIKESGGILPVLLFGANFRVPKSAPNVASTTVLKKPIICKAGALSFCFCT